ncbi:MAG: type II secretion system protein GspJ [Candidatus Omnitrophica bacterium]|nr:type II secretion system protein GspJ [Candidatus Omnitrophota bacterium]
MMEILVAVLIISFLAGVLYTTFSHGMDVWRRAVRGFPESDMDIFFDKVSTDLRNAFAFLPKSLMGTTHSVQFYTLVPSGDFTVTIVKEPMQEPARVRYDFDRDHKAIWRRQERYPQILYAYSGLQPRVAKLAEGISNIELEYYAYDENAKKFVWSSGWDKSYLPCAVRMKLTSEKPSAKKVFMRVISIPAGMTAN